METQMTTLLIMVAVIALIVIIYLIKWITEKLRKKAAGEAGLNSSYFIMLSFQIVAFCIILPRTISVFKEAVDIIIKVIDNNQLWIITKTASVFIGLSMVYYLISYYLSSPLLLILIGRHKDKIEIERNNFAYFILKGIILICVVLSLSIIFENILRLFIPVIDIPFYH